MKKVLAILFVMAILFSGCGGEVTPVTPEFSELDVAAAVPGYELRALLGVSDSHAVLSLKKGEEYSVALFNIATGSIDKQVTVAGEAAYYSNEVFGNNKVIGRLYGGLTDTVVGIVVIDTKKQTVTTHGVRDEYYKSPFIVSGDLSKVAVTRDDGLYIGDIKLSSGNMEFEKLEKIDAFKDVVDNPEVDKTPVPVTFTDKNKSLIYKISGNDKSYGIGVYDLSKKEDGFYDSLRDKHAMLISDQKILYFSDDGDVLPAYTIDHSNPDQPVDILYGDFNKDIYENTRFAAISVSPNAKFSSLVLTDEEASSIRLTDNVDKTTELGKFSVDNLSIQQVYFAPKSNLLAAFAGASETAPAKIYVVKY